MDTGYGRHHQIEFPPKFIHQLGSSRWFLGWNLCQAYCQIWSNCIHTSDFGMSDSILLDQHSVHPKQALQVSFKLCEKMMRKLINFWQDYRVLWGTNDVFLCHSGYAWYHTILSASTGLGPSARISLLVSKVLQPKCTYHYDVSVWRLLLSQGK